MKKSRGPVPAWCVFATQTVLLTAILHSNIVAAQKTPPPPSQDRTKTYDANSELRGRDANITLIERAKTEAENREAVLKQMNEDLDRIQALNAALVGAFVPNSSPDYTRISEDSAELKKRAIRLKSNLALPPTPKDEKHPKSKAEQDQVQPLVGELNDLVKSFVASPLFTRNAVLDYQLLAKARRDLDGITELSERIRKTSDSLRKAVPKSN